MFNDRSMVGFVLILVGTSAAASEQLPHYENRFGASPEQCRAFHRKSAGPVTVKSAERRTHPGVSAQLLGERSMTGRALTVEVAGAGGSTRQLLAYAVDENTITLKSSDRSAPEKVLVRCGQKDAVAGIGLDTQPSRDSAARAAAIFAGAYAKAVPAICPRAKPVDGRSDALIGSGRLAWLKDLVDSKLTTYGPDAYVPYVDHKIAQIARRAQAAVKADASQIPAFCEEVLGAFGRGGRVVPGLIEGERGSA